MTYNREKYNIEFVENNFSVTKTSACPNCGFYICFLPDMKNLIKEDSKVVIDLLKAQGLKIKEVDKIKVKEWYCHNCKTIYVNIQEKTICK